MSKRERNSVLIAKRKAALGGSAAALNRKGRNAAELAVIKNKQKMLGKKTLIKLTDYDRKVFISIKSFGKVQ